MRKGSNEAAQKTNHKDDKMKTQNNKVNLNEKTLPNTKRFKEIDYDLTSAEVDSVTGEKIAYIYLTTHNDVEITLRLPRSRISDLDVSNVLVKASHL